RRGCGRWLPAPSKPPVSFPARQSSPPSSTRESDVACDAWCASLGAGAHCRHSRAGSATGPPGVESAGPGTLLRLPPGSRPSMPELRDDDVTGLLRAWSAGDEQALHRLMPLVERELNRI